MKKLCTRTRRMYTREEYITENLASLPSADLLGTQWDNDCISVLDSSEDTMKHIKRVQNLLSGAAMELLKRGIDHDASKLSSSEKPYFDNAMKLSGIVYGSEEYRKALDDIKPALEHHYANNRHHPEHHENGISGMNLFDLLEMFLDWMAASERHANGSIMDSIDINQKRFGMSDQLAEIFRNTADLYVRDSR